jgi:pantothenate kinase
VTSAGFSPELAALTGRVLARAEGRDRFVLGVTGPPGAGKSTLVEALLARLRGDPAGSGDPGWVRHVPMDGFHLADDELDRLGLRHRKGAPATFDVGGYVATLRRLRDREPLVYAPAFERDLEQPLAGAIPVPASARVVLTEGNYLLCADGGWALVAPLLDEVWYVDADDDLRWARLVARHVRFGKARRHAEDWVRRSDEPNARLVAATRDRADLVVRAR